MLEVVTASVYVFLLQNRGDPASLSQDALLTLLSAERKVTLQCYVSDDQSNNNITVFSIL